MITRDIVDYKDSDAGRVVLYKNPNHAQYDVAARDSAVAESLSTLLDGGATVPAHVANALLQGFGFTLPDFPPTGKTQVRVDAVPMAALSSERLDYLTCKVGNKDASIVVVARAAQDDETAERTVTASVSGQALRDALTVQTVDAANADPACLRAVVWLLAGKLAVSDCDELRSFLTQHCVDVDSATLSVC